MAQVHGIEPEAPEPTSLTGHPVATRTGLAAWLSYEFAQNAFFTTLAIFIFPLYVQNYLVESAVQGQVVWGYTVGAAGFVLALCAPLIGSTTDFAGARKPPMIVMVAVSLIATGLMMFARPGVENALWIALISYGIAAVTLEIAAVLHNAMLPGIVSERRVGSLSGLGIAFANFGALVTVVIWLLFLSDDLLAVVPLSIVWMIVFALPLFLLTPDIPRSPLTYVQSARAGVKGLIKTFSKLGHYRNIALFLAARTIYYDGMITIFAFVSVFVAGVYGWPPATVLYFGIGALVAGAVGAIIGGYIDDLFGSKRTIILSVILFAIGLGLGLAIAPDNVPWLPLAWQGEGAQFTGLGPALSALGITTFSGQVYCVVSLIGSIFLGPALGASRAMLARLAPPSMTAEFFGLYTLTGKMTAYIGPFAIAFMTDVTNNQRAGMSIIIFFLMAGAIMMLLVKEQPTEAAAH